MRVWWGPLISFGLQQFMAMGRQQVERDDKFAAARIAAFQTGRPLLVVGGPWGDAGLRKALNWPCHGHGDICMDIDPRACGEDHFVFGDVRDIPFPDRFFGAVFCSHVLEHMPTPEDCEIAVHELWRVADEVFICVPGKGTLLAWLAPTHHLWVREVEPGVVIAQPMKPRRVV